MKKDEIEKLLEALYLHCDYCKFTKYCERRVIINTRINDYYILTFCSEFINRGERK